MMKPGRKAGLRFVGSLQGLVGDRVKRLVPFRDNRAGWHHALWLRSLRKPDGPLQLAFQLEQQLDAGCVCALCPDRRSTLIELRAQRL